MTTSEPAWRIKTRPCPFYQRGSCIFAQSCNFMHTMPVRQPNTNTDNPPSGPQSPKVAEPLPYSRPLEPPIVNVESPRSIRSPPRSPRITGLLFALKDVIGDEAFSEEGDGQTPIAGEPESATWSAGLQTLVHGADTTFFAQITETMAEMMRATEEYSNEEPYQFSDSYFNDSTSSTMSQVSARPRVSGSASQSEQLVHRSFNGQSLCIPSTSLCDPHDTPSIHTTHSSPDPEQILEMPKIPENHNDLLSPVDLSHIHLNNFALDDITDSGNDTNSFDSGFVDSYKPPLHLLKSPPRSPAMSSTFELLNSPFGSSSARVLSPRLSAFIGRSPASPLKQFPANQDEISKLDLSLDSPSDYRPCLPSAVEELEGSRTARIFDQPLDFDSNPFQASESPNLHSSDDERVVYSDDSYESSEEIGESYGHTSVWDTNGDPTALYLGNKSPMVQEVLQEIERQNVTPLLPLYGFDRPWEDGEIESLTDLRTSNSSFTGLRSTFDNDSFEEGEEDEEKEEVQIQEQEEVAQDEQERERQKEQEEQEERKEQKEQKEQKEWEDEVAERHHSLYSEDTTALLGYLQPDTHDGDTLNSLYDVYSALAPHPKDLTPTPNSSAPSSSLPERVFTPPPQGRNNSRTILADSPISLSSPITSLDSLSRDCSSPSSIISSSKHSPHEGPDSPQDPFGELSRKVPFGFRHSKTLGPISRSSLVSIKNRSLPRLASSNVVSLEAGRGASPSPPSSASPTAGSLRPLRLSTLLHEKSHPRSSFVSPNNITSNYRSQNVHRESACNVSSSNPLSSNPMLSSALPNFMSSHLRNTFLESQERSPSLLTDDLNHLATFDSPITAPMTIPLSWPSNHSTSRFDHIRSSSRLSEPIYEQDGEDDTTHRHDVRDETIRRALPALPHTAPVTRTAPAYRQPMYAIATPRPTLMFAIASDDVEQVRQVLRDGDAGPNDSVGPQSALAFTLTNDQLRHKLDIVKTLLAFGADPSNLKDPGLFPRRQGSETEEGRSSEAEPHQSSKILMKEMDPATRYYVKRADAPHTRRSSLLIQRSFFRPLTRVRYELIGQDRALEELFKLLSIHSRQLSISPIVVMLCGPSGHGKSLLARRFGSLLDVPAHTVNMVTLRSQDNLWESYSMSPYEKPTNCTLAEFLINNEGKRCIVVLDEIEKVEDEKVLWSLLMPWEHGRCSFEAKSRYIDMRNVIWLCTSNIGHDLVFKHRDTRQNPEETLTREEYLELMSFLRPRVSERLGASVLSRVTSVLPFVPFTLDEKRAICAEAIYQLGREDVLALPSQSIDSLVESALMHYIPEEGARSLHRAVSNELVEMI